MNAVIIFNSVVDSKKRYTTIQKIIGSGYAKHNF